MSQIDRKFSVISYWIDGKRLFLKALSEWYPDVHLGQLAEYRHKMDDLLFFLNVISILNTQIAGGIWEWCYWSTNLI
jgi:hypothetical protein